MKFVSVKHKLMEVQQTMKSLAAQDVKGLRLPMHWESLTCKTHKCLQMRILTPAEAWYYGAASQKY